MPTNKNSLGFTLSASTMTHEGEGASPPLRRLSNANAPFSARPFFYIRLSLTPGLLSLAKQLCLMAAKICWRDVIELLGKEIKKQSMEFKNWSTIVLVLIV